uniref:Uncharacterized protein n=1 Tax=Esox lucius TaxID=8010 RepID=A0AAY5K9K2_ESOLU
VLGCLRACAFPPFHVHCCFRDVDVTHSSLPLLISPSHPCLSVCLSFSTPSHSLPLSTPLSLPTYISKKQETNELEQRNNNGNLAVFLSFLFFFGDSPIRYFDYDAEPFVFKRSHFCTPNSISFLLG